MKTKYIILFITILFVLVCNIIVFQTGNKKVDAMLINKISHGHDEIEIKKADVLSEPKITMQGLEADNVYYHYYLDKAIEKN